MKAISCSLVLFDYGGVLAEEGFHHGLRAIGASRGLDPRATFEAGRELVYATGFATGTGTEAAFWQAFRQRLGIRDRDEVLRREILERFVLRPWTLELVDSLRAAGRTVAILSDQTCWLDELDARDDFFGRFDRVFNSYHAGLSKQGDAFFLHALETMGATPAQTIFVDDSAANVERACSLGLTAILYTGPEALLAELNAVCPLP